MCVCLCNSVCTTLFCQLSLELLCDFLDTDLKKTFPRFKLFKLDFQAGINWFIDDCRDCFDNSHSTYLPEGEFEFFRATQIWQKDLGNKLLTDFRACLLS